VETDQRPVVLTGPNGAGKTNLLEALSFLVPGRGLRGARLNEVARLRETEPQGSGAWAVAARVMTPMGPVEIGTGREADGGTGGRERRVVRIDGQPVKSQAALGEHCAALWLTPRMDRLFAEGAAGRRRFLDRLVFGFDPAHAGRVSAYEHALRERARLLQGRGRGRGQSQGQGQGQQTGLRADASWISALEDTMATRGVAVAAARRETVERMNRACREAPGPFPRAGLAVEGSVESWLDQGPALAAEDRFRSELAESRGRDADAGGARVGTHKSDLRVCHLAKGQPAELCSTGEQKALLIAIVLANAGVLAAERGTVPLLLLDEVAAHLDQARREALFEEITGLGAQAWLTGTDVGLFQVLGDRAQFLSVVDAVVGQQA
jgi:DNA replication and repair protein RecF